MDDAAVPQERPDVRPDVKPDRRRAVLGVIFALAIVVACGVAVQRQWDAFVDALGSLGLAASALSFAAAVLTVLVTFVMWRAVMLSLHGDLGNRWAARTFFLSQLGKYLPGSVWPIVIQMEAGRIRGVPRRTMLAGNLLSLLLTCSVGLVLGGVLLSLEEPSVVRRYWWVFLSLPFFLAALHPRALSALLDRLLRVIGREPLGQRSEPGPYAVAVALAVLVWFGFGAHLAILLAALGHSGLDVFLLCTGGMALAFTAGVLALPAPAGGGVRELILVLALGQVLTSGEAIAVALASRALLTLADVAIAGVVAGLTAGGTRSAPPAG